MACGLNGMLLMDAQLLVEVEPRIEHELAQILHPQMVGRIALALLQRDRLVPQIPVQV